ncbi:hypothetical protein DF043_14055 [Burkholderia cepacia]|nr:hypothetical protein DF043_14055 [Burkholderia cepacia]
MRGVRSRVLVRVRAGGCVLGAACWGLRVGGCVLGAACWGLLAAGCVLCAGRWALRAARLTRRSHA